MKGRATRTPSNDPDTHSRRPRDRTSRPEAIHRRSSRHGGQRRSIERQRSNRCGTRARFRCGAARHLDARQERHRYAEDAKARQARAADSDAVRLRRRSIRRELVEGGRRGIPEQGSRLDAARRRDSHRRPWAQIREPVARADPRRWRVGRRRPAVARRAVAARVPDLLQAGGGRGGLEDRR